VQGPAGPTTPVADNTSNLGDPTHRFHDFTQPELQKFGSTITVDGSAKSRSIASDDATDSFYLSQ